MTNLKVTVTVKYRNGTYNAYVKRHGATASCTASGQAAAIFSARKVFIQQADCETAMNKANGMLPLEARVHHPETKDIKVEEVAGGYEITWEREGS